MAGLNKFRLSRDINGYPSVGVPQPSVGFTATLTTGGGEDSITVPSSADNWVAKLHYEPATTVLVAVNATAALPAGATFAASTSMVNPPELIVNAGDTISAITGDATADVSISLYPVNNNQ